MERGAHRPFPSLRRNGRAAGGEKRVFHEQPALFHAGVPVKAGGPLVRLMRNVDEMEAAAGQFVQQREIVRASERIES